MNMGKKHKEAHRFNKHARSQQHVVVGPNTADSVQLELPVDARKYDESNQLVLPSKKRKTVLKKEDTKQQKFLSRKQRKKLEKIVERREKKSNRADIVSELQNYQLSSETYKLLTPLVKIQTEGVRSFTDEDLITPEVISGPLAGPKKPKSGWKRSGTILANKQKYLSWSRRFVQGGAKAGADNVLGFSDRDDSSDTDEEDLEGEAEENGRDTGDEDHEVEEESQPDEVEEIGTNSAEEEMNVDKEVIQLSSESVDNSNSEEKQKVVQEDSKKCTNVKAKPDKTPKRVIHVDRTSEIEAVRAKLPIIPEEQVIMEQITENLSVVLAGETGCGKTTQVPQFLYEAGYAADGRLIGITEPRRVAAISMARRVAEELNLTDDEVSYQIRFEGNVTPKTLIKFMTDGVLLKEMGHDFLLKKYSVICIDEAHERSLFTDILIGLLSRCVLVRKKRNDPLKLIVMSATMRVEDFLENSILFKRKPGFVHIPARQFPVQIHFSKFTPENYVKAALKKVAQIHKNLPPGGILVFVTGQQEVLTICKNLEKLFPSSGKKISEATKPGKWKKRRHGNDENARQLKTINLDEAKQFPLKEVPNNSDPESDDTDEEDMEIDEDVSNCDPLHVLPLYSMLPTDQQQKIFETPPQGARLCVISTNVAETSLTIPSIRYVVDTGKVKEKLWDKVTGVQTFKVMWCSKASSEQRSGRAGRVGPGHCYRLFSSAVFDNDFPQYSTPEIKSRPVDDMVLLMKSMAIDNVHNFPYPTHPGDVQLSAAETILYNLGALEPVGSTDAKRYRITKLGETMAEFPVGPRYAKMLAMSFTYSLGEYMILLAAALTVQEVFLESNDNQESNEYFIKLRKKWAGTGLPALLGDALVLIKAVLGYEKEKGSIEYCRRSGLRHKAMVEIRKLRRQLTQHINSFLPESEQVALNPALGPPNNDQARLLRQIILSGCPDRIARKATADEVADVEDLHKRKYAFKCAEFEELAYIHSNSSLKKKQPLWIVYQEAFEHNGKIMLRGITAIDPDWIYQLCTSLCTIEKTLKDPPPYYDESSQEIKCSVKATYSKQGWELPTATVEHPLNTEKYRYFAQFLLEGEVFPSLSKWKPHLVSSPVTMTKSWADLQPRTQYIFQTLVSSNVHSKSTLEAAWQENANFLLEEYLSWISEKVHDKVRSSWPPLS